MNIMVSLGTIPIAVEILLYAVASGIGLMAGVMAGVMVDRKMRRGEEDS